MTLASCYSMEPIVTPTQITMTILTTMAPLSSSIYGESTITFVNDTDAYKTVDINLSKISSISHLSWCSKSPFTVNTVT
jgi:hypothetical protein